MILPLAVWYIKSNASWRFFLLSENTLQSLIFGFLMRGAGVEFQVRKSAFLACRLKFYYMSDEQESREKKKYFMNTQFQVLIPYPPRKFIFFYLIRSVEAHVYQCEQIVKLCQFQENHSPYSELAVPCAMRIMLTDDEIFMHGDAAHAVKGSQTVVQMVG